MELPDWQILLGFGILFLAAALAAWLIPIFADIFAMKKVDEEG